MSQRRFRTSFTRGSSEGAAALDDLLDPVFACYFGEAHERNGECMSHFGLFAQLGFFPFALGVGTALAVRLGRSVAVVVSIGRGASCLLASGAACVDLFATATPFQARCRS